jgi:hypothetical protein
MLQLHESLITGKTNPITVELGSGPRQTLRARKLTEIQKADLLLHSLYDAALCADRVAMKLDYVATALRRQFISYDSAVEWLFRLGLLGYVDREQFRQTKHTRTCTNQLIAVIGKISK